MYDTLVEFGLDEVRLFGFASFEGLPAGADKQDAGVWQPGSFKAEIETVRARLAAAGVPSARATLVKGWFNETLNAATAARLGLARAGVIMLDADLCGSSKEALDFCAPLIRDEAVLICDDWYASGGDLREGTLAELGLGQKRAFGEFLAEHPQLAAEGWGCYGPAGRIFLVWRRP